MKTNAPSKTSEVTPKMAMIALASFVAKIFAILWLLTMILPGEKWSTFCAKHIMFAVIGFLLVGYFLFSKKNGWKFSR